MGFIIAVDGGSGTGKGTVTRYVADKLGLSTIDTGALYRCITLEVLNKQISLDNKRALENIVKEMNVDLKTIDNNQIVILNGNDVSIEIRTPRVTSNVSIVAAIPEVRYQLVKIQRKLAEGKNIIMEGRDIGTAVFPNAETSYEDVLKSIQNRDKNDSTREVNPLKKAEDAIVVKTDGFSAEEGGEAVYKVVINELKKKGLI